MSEEVIRMSAVMDDKVIPVGSVSADTPMGSITSDELDGTRRVYLFGWYEDGRHGLFESAAGFDSGNVAVRMITSVNLVLLSDLAEPYDLHIHRFGEPRHIRFNLEESR